VADSAVRWRTGPTSQARLPERNLIDVNEPWSWDEQTILASVSRLPAGRYLTPAAHAEAASYVADQAGPARAES